MTPLSVDDRSSLPNMTINFQVFNSNYALSEPGEWQLVKEVGTSIFDFGVYFSYLKSCFMSVIGAFGFPTQRLLRDFKFLIQPIKMLWVSYLLAVAIHNRLEIPTSIPTFLSVGGNGWTVVLPAGKQTIYQMSLIVTVEGIQPLGRNLARLSAIVLYFSKPKLGT